MRRNCTNACAGNFGYPIAPGGSMKLTFASREPGRTSTGRSTRRAPLSISCCRRSVIGLQPSTSCKWHCGGRGQPRVLNVDGHASYPPDIAGLKEARDLSRRCQCRPCPYLNNVLKQDHRFVKKRIAAILWFCSVDGALRTIAGYEAMNMIRKGQVRWLAKGDVVGQIRFIERTFGVAA
jgi:hypothetical protein